MWAMRLCAELNKKNYFVELLRGASHLRHIPIQFFFHFFITKNIGNGFL